MKKAITALVLAACSVFVFAQNTPPKVSVTLPKTAKPGAVVKGTVTVTFAPGLHGYQNPPSEEFLIPVKIESSTKGILLKSVKYPKGISEKTAAEDKAVMVYEGTISIPFTVAMPKKPGKVSLSIKVDYQQCNTSSCFPPSTESGSAAITVKK